MKRYRLIQADDGQGQYGELKDDADGELVFFDDAMVRVDELEAENSEMRMELSNLAYERGAAK